MTKANGYTIYRGPSMIDGSPIVAIATGFVNGSNNVKTGDMIQVWILREDVSPTDAIKSGEDKAICGNCPHRGRLLDDGTMGARSCYVEVGRAPLGVWRSYHGLLKGQNGTGIYPMAQDLAALGEGRRIRLGAYGDPAAVPRTSGKLSLSGQRHTRVIRTNGAIATQSMPNGSWRPATLKPIMSRLRREAIGRSAFVQRATL